MNKQCLRPTHHVQAQTCNQTGSMFREAYCKTKALGPVYIHIQLIMSDHPNHFYFPQGCINEYIWGRGNDGVIKYLFNNQYNH